MLVAPQILKGVLSEKAKDIFSHNIAVFLAMQRFSWLLSLLRESCHFDRWLNWCRGVKYLYIFFGVTVKCILGHLLGN